MIRALVDKKMSGGLSYLSTFRYVPRLWVSRYLNLIPSRLKSAESYLEVLLWWPLWFSSVGAGDSEYFHNVIDLSLQKLIGEWSGLLGGQKNFRNAREIRRPALSRNFIEISTDKSISASLITRDNSIYQNVILSPHIRTWIISICLIYSELYVFIIQAFAYRILVGKPEGKR
jgi:hypothetical protein